MFIIEGRFSQKGKPYYISITGTGAGWNKNKAAAEKFDSEEDARWFINHRIPNSGTVKKIIPAD